jgi:excisionase family DNA binding protein
MAAEPELITIEEAAQYLRVCEKTLYRWLRDGRIRAYRAGRAWRFRRVDLDGWLLAQQNPVSGEGDDDAGAGVAPMLAELRRRNREALRRPGGEEAERAERWIKAGRKRLVAAE